MICSRISCTASSVPRNRSLHTMPGSLVSLSSTAIDSILPEISTTPARQYCTCNALRTSSGVVSGVLKRNDEFRAMTSNQCSRDNAAMRSDGSASAMSNVCADAPTCRKGRMAILGRECGIGTASGVPAGSGSETLRRVVTSAMKQKPMPCTVRITLCACPSSPTACRTDLIRLESADSDTIRPSQTEARISCLVTVRPALTTSSCNSAKTCGSTGTRTLDTRSSYRPVSSSKSANRYIIAPNSIPSPTNSPENLQIVCKRLQPPPDKFSTWTCDSAPPT